MKKLTFKTSEDFDDYFKGESPDITNGIVASIVYAMQSGKKSANLLKYNSEILIIYLIYLFHINNGFRH